jgi:hypothetical protein
MFVEGKKDFDREGCRVFGAVGFLKCSAATV